MMKCQIAVLLALNDSVVTLKKNLLEYDRTRN